LSRLSRRPRPSATEISINANAEQPLSMKIGISWCRIGSRKDRTPGSRILSHGNVDSHTESSTVKPGWAPKLDVGHFPNFCELISGIFQRSRNLGKNFHHNKDRGVRGHGGHVLQTSEGRGASLFHGKPEGVEFETNPLA